MSLKIIITKNFQKMSDEAAEIIIKDINKFKPSKEKKYYILGLATGNSPTGIYKILVNSANNDQFNPSRVISFNLDEYVGLPGKNVQDRLLHPESFTTFMQKNFFKLLNKKLNITYLPKANEIDQNKLIYELEIYKNDINTYELLGKGKGKQISIKKDCKSEYLKWIKKEIIDDYINEIKKYGGIDLHIIGVGGRGHVGFHESGIPLDQEMLLVKLDDNTIKNAITDGHFPSFRDAPKYAVSMGVKSIFTAKTVLLIANGKRKTQPITKALLGPITEDIPISYSQKYASKGGNMIYVLEEEAAKDILGNFDQLKAKGFEIIDKR